jgi:Ca2+-binding RTX toxin-like protein
VSRYIYGLAGSNDFTGGASVDRFTIYGGSFSINAGDGDDIISIDDIMTTDQRIDGGAGYDVVQIGGLYPSGIMFDDATMVNVERLRLVNGDNYSLAMNELTVGERERLVIDGSRLTEFQLTLDASAETDGYYTVLGGGAADVFSFNLANFSKFNIIKGGGGSSLDELRFTTSGTFSATTLASVSGVERLYLGDGSDNLTLTDALVGSAYNRLLTVFGGGGADTINGGAVSAANKLRYYGGQGSDLLTASAGADQFSYFYVSESTGSNYDTIVGMDLSVDRFNIPGPNPITAIDVAVTTGALSTSTFNANLASTLSAARLGAHHAVAFTPSSGALAGETFLVADMNGVAGYQANVDFVVRLTNETGVLAASTFI